MKKLFKKLSVSFLIGILLVSTAAPLYAALTYRYRYGGIIQTKTGSYSYTSGGSAYDDRGIPLRAELVAGIGNKNGWDYGTLTFTGSTEEAARSVTYSSWTNQYHTCRAK